MGSSSGWLPRLILGVLLLLAAQGGNCEHEPTESECRPYIQKALKEHHISSDESTVTTSGETSTEQEENPPTGDTNEDSNLQGSESTEIVEERSSDQVEVGTDSDSNKTDEENDTAEEGGLNTNEETDEAQTTNEDTEGQQTQEVEGSSENENNEDTDNTAEEQADDSQETQGSENAEGDTVEEQSDEQGDAAETEGSVDGDTAEDTVGSDDTAEDGADSIEGDTVEEAASLEGDTAEDGAASIEGDTAEETADSVEGDGADEATESIEGDTAEETPESIEGDTVEDVQESVEGDTVEETGESKEADGSQEADTQEKTDESAEQSEGTGEVETIDQSGEGSQETDKIDQSEESQEAVTTEDGAKDSEEGETKEEGSGTAEEVAVSDEKESEEGSGDKEGSGEDAPSSEKSEAEETVEVTQSEEKEADQPSEENKSAGEAESTEAGKSEEESSEKADVTSAEDSSKAQSQEVPVEDLTQETVIPTNLRSRDHLTQILRLDEQSMNTDSALGKSVDSTLKTLKNLYDNAIKPLEILYKYRDLSNRHFGDPEIFSKPLVLFMGPWSGGKSSTINYLLNLEFGEMALRTGAEPSPAYFNILMHGEEPEILDGTQLAADWTFSGLQKFGQGLLDRLRGVRLPNPLLEKVNIVEIPGILEIRKQVQRLFPFNDACQWFIDRADIIFLVYDPAKLDVGPETEAILDQLKGREYQTRIILNKADQVKPEELMRVQGTLIWNISPLMSSQEPPVMYTTSLWSLPFEPGAPARLLLAQERAFLRDMREAIDKRIENKIASARRFAVRVRNHAKMVDCYLTTYYNHKTFFGNKKKISDDIIENPTKYHIYEGLSTLTNISRYDLPDPEMYRDFFRINPLYDFTKLSDTCTYFRGCPINKLDIAIAYDLPEVVGKYKKAVEASKTKS